MTNWQVFFGRRFVVALVVVLFFVLLSHYWPIFIFPTVIMGLVVLFITLSDFALLFTGLGVGGRHRKEADMGSGLPVWAERVAPERMSNTDDNEVVLKIWSRYRFRIAATVYDEIPDEFQLFNFGLKAVLRPDEQTTISYNLHPRRRGLLYFRKINVVVYTPMHFVERRIVCGYDSFSKVYPSFLFIRNRQLLSIENRDKEMGLKHVRRTGSSMEFDTIREYVVNDDYRTINWKATARRRTIMVNQFEAEQSQQVYLVIDTGRGMQHSFSGVTLLDYSVNAAMQLAYIALRQQDSVGLMTLGDSVDIHIKAAKETLQMNRLMEGLYDISTDFAQTSYSDLFEYVRKNVGKRSLFIIFTTFSTLADMRKQLPFLRNMAARHRVVLIFFEDEDMRCLAQADRKTNEDYAVHVLAQESVEEMRLVAKELRRNGLIAVLSKTTTVSSDALNAYMAVKSRSAI